MKWLIDLYPRERYGQFGSTGAMVSSIGAALIGSLCGFFLRLCKRLQSCIFMDCSFLPGRDRMAGVTQMEKTMGDEAGYKAPNGITVEQYDVKKVEL